MKIRAQKLSGISPEVNPFIIHPLGSNQLGYLDQEDIDNLDNISKDHFFLKFSVKKTAYVFYLKAIKLVPDSIIIEIEDSLLTVSQVVLPRFMDDDLLKNNDLSEGNSINKTNSVTDAADIEATEKTDAISDCSTTGDSAMYGFAHTFALPLFVKMNALELYYRDNILLIVLPRE